MGMTVAAKGLKQVCSPRIEGTLRRRKHSVIVFVTRVVDRLMGNAFHSDGITDHGVTARTRLAAVLEKDQTNAVT